MCLLYKPQTRRIVLQHSYREDEEVKQDNNKVQAVYMRPNSRQANATGWFFSIVMLVALCIIGYLVFEANDVKLQSAQSAQAAAK